MWTERLASPREPQLVVVGTDGGTVRGFVCAYAQGDAGWGVFIDNLHVAASHHGTGVGTSLLHVVARWANRERPGEPPYLWVLEPNRSAQRFYERRGAVQREATVRENPGGGGATYLRYAWPRPAAMLASSCARAREPIHRRL